MAIDQIAQSGLSSLKVIYYSAQLFSLIILLHGVGSSGDDLLPLADAWKHQLPGCDFTSPDAPTHSDFGQGYQWFSLVGVTEQNRPRRIQAARASFDTTLARLMAVRGLEGQPEKVVLAGFSQGATMALDAVASGRWPGWSLFPADWRHRSP